MNPFESMFKKNRDNVVTPEKDALAKRQQNWFRRKLGEFIDTHPTATQAVLAGMSATALVEHLANENRWSVENPTLPLTLAVILGSASVSRWLTKRYENRRFK